MMPSHETLVYIAKSYGLFYLIALSIVVLAYLLAGQKGRLRARRQSNP